MGQKDIQRVGSGGGGLKEGGIQDVIQFFGLDVWADGGGFYWGGQ